ncbi:unnamed protein product, partial [marine sediment metagenome]
FVDKRPISLIGIEKEKYGIFLHDLVKVNNHKLPVQLLDIKNIPRPDRNSEELGPEPDHIRTVISAEKEVK